MLAAKFEGRWCCLAGVTARDARGLPLFGPFFSDGIGSEVGPSSVWKKLAQKWVRLSRFEREPEVRLSRLEREPDPFLDTFCHTELGPSSVWKKIVQIWVRHSHLEREI